MTLWNGSIAWLALIAGASGQEKQPKAQFELVCDVDAVVPGQTLTVGLHIRHAPGWHTYWKNAGTVGMATRIDWTLPEGCKAGPILWQQPQLTKMGVYTVWGYEGTALLLTDITIPKDLPTDEKFEITAVVSYMACAKTCQPGNTKIVLVLPRRGETQRSRKWGPRFDSIRRQQPQPLDGAWKIRAVRRGETYLMLLTPRKGANPDIRTLYFFSADRMVSSDAKQRFERDGERLILTVQREKFTPANGTGLRGVLYCAGGFKKGGKVQAIVVDAPLPQVKFP